MQPPINYYRAPFRIPQKPNPLSQTPLLRCRLANCSVVDDPLPEGYQNLKLAPLDNFATGVMQGPQLAGSKLFMVVPVANASSDVTNQPQGVAWLVVNTKTTKKKPNMTVTASGFITAPGGGVNSLLYPSIAVDAAGKSGVIAFSLSGLDCSPTAAFAVIQKGVATGTVYIAAGGVGPYDAKSGYAAVGNYARWGDYSSAVVDEKGNFWSAQECVATVGGLCEGRGGWRGHCFALHCPE